MFTNIKKHFLNTLLNVEGRIPKLVLNVDEWEERRKCKIFVRRETERKIIKYPVSRKIPHMTLLACISCSGKSLTSLIITKKANNKSFWDSGISKDKEVIIRQKNKHYVDLNTFEEYILNVIIPYVMETRKKLQKQNAETVLLMDSLSTHCSQKVFQILGFYNILTFFYPSHTTNLFHKKEDFFDYQIL